MARPKKSTKPAKPPEIPLDWQVPDNVPTHHVTNAVVQITGDQFVLSFFEQRGPIIITDKDRENVLNLESAKALCVARICITPEKMESFATVFKRQYDRYMESINKPPESPGK